MPLTGLFDGDQRPHSRGAVFVIAGPPGIARNRLLIELISLADWDSRPALLNITPSSEPSRP